MTVDDVPVYPEGIEKFFHPPDHCIGRCTIHNPSEHPMRGFSINIRETALAERICPHGIGHPDPDSLQWAITVTGSNSWAAHGCDGCCEGAYDEVVFLDDSATEGEA